MHNNCPHRHVTRSHPAHTPIRCLALLLDNAKTVEEWLQDPTTVVTSAAVLSQYRKETVDQIERLLPTAVRFLRRTISSQWQDDHPALRADPTLERTPADFHEPKLRAGAADLEPRRDHVE